MEGNEDNAAVVDYIWSNLGNKDSAVEYVVDPARDTQQQIPCLHPSCLAEEENAVRRQHMIDAKVTRRINLERQA